MKFTCNKQELTEAVSNVQRSVCSKSSLPALEGILLKTSDSAISLCGYDLEMGITTVIPASIGQQGEVVLNARLFSEIVRRLPAETVTIEIDDKLIANIESGQSSFSIVGIDASEYPEMPSIQDDDCIEMTQAMLKSMIRQTLFAVAESDNKPVHTGTLFEIEDGVIKLVSVDGYRLAMRTERIQGNGSFHFVVPGKTLNEVLKLLGDEENKLTLHVAKRHILFEIDHYTVISRLLEGEFLDYNSAIGGSNNAELLVDTRNFMNSVERVSLLITDRLKSPVRCIFSKEEIKLSCSTSIGKASDSCPCQMQGEELEMGFNNRYLLDALRNADGDQVKLQFNSPLSPMKVLPKEGDSFLFLVLPVRLK